MFVYPVFLVTYLTDPPIHDWGPKDFCEANTYARPLIVRCTRERQPRSWVAVRGRRVGLLVRLLLAIVRVRLRLGRRRVC